MGKQERYIQRCLNTDKFYQRWAKKGMNINTKKARLAEIEGKIIALTQKSIDLVDATDPKDASKISVTLLGYNFEIVCLRTEYFHVITQSIKQNQNTHTMTGESYDSTADTLLHIKRVSQLLTEAASELIRRANCHDDSKLLPPEKEGFDNAAKLKNITYGSQEYKNSLAELKPALDHHYANNSHHPEHYENGVDGMNLFDLIEMFFDWKAAGERHADGNIYKSIEFGKSRFSLSEQVSAIFTNTAKLLQY